MPRHEPEPELFILELDMAPMAYMDIPLDIVTAGERQIQRVHAHTLRVKCIKDETTAQRGSDLLEMVRAALRGHGGGIIWWRRRPRVDDNGHWSCRLGTSPSLPEKFWNAIAPTAEDWT